MSNSPERTQKETRTPAVKIRPWSLTFQGDWPAYFTKLIILSPRIGNTQGMRFKMSPPMKANTRAFERVGGVLRSFLRVTGISLWFLISTARAEVFSLLLIQPLGLTKMPWRELGSSPWRGRVRK